MAGDLFHDLPPPSAPQSQQIAHSTISQESSPKPPPPPPAPALKSALKRPKPQLQPEGTCCKSFGIFYYLLYLLSLLIWFFVFVLL